MNIATRVFVLFILFSLTFSAPLWAQSLPPAAPAARALQALEPLQIARTVSAHRAGEITSLTLQEGWWINETRTLNTFQSGLLQSQYTYRWEGNAIGEWRDSLLTVYAYGPGGTLTAVTTSAYGGSPGRWNGLERSLYTTENGVVTGIRTQLMQDDAWVDYERETFTRSGGLVVESVTEMWDGEAWTPTERYTLAEGEGASVVQTILVWNGAEWLHTERFIFTSMTMELLPAYLEDLAERFSDYEGLFFGLRLPDGIAQEWNGEGWLNVARQTSNRWYGMVNFHTYLMKEEITTDAWAGEAWESGFRMAVDYTQPPYTEGLPAKTAVQLFDGASWIDLFVERYIIQTDIRRIVQSTLETDFGAGMQEVSRVLIDWVEVVAVDAEADQAPDRFALDQNYPNPFNPATRITYRLEAPQRVRLAVYDLLGREVALLDDGLKSAGEHIVRWDAAGLPSGTYLYRLDAGDASATRRMTLTK